MKSSSVVMFDRRGACKLFVTIYDFLCYTILVSCAAVGDITDRRKSCIQIAG